ncbi:hypothetical protein F396_gp08 [Pectobacterium phage ZF40]|uniref:hypothetical protein n=1 Tax=Pectobacterium phage ZF40 TaxID=1127516 RepID=UPI0002536E53|nr:hypothetical protein F396_gp08 [Pectobacterium phage ZF40]AFC22460.1 hypothetical protein ZF40_0008 [Pectobacterium phage ZF40]
MGFDLSLPPIFFADVKKPAVRQAPLPRLTDQSITGNSCGTDKGNRKARPIPTKLIPISRDYTRNAMKAPEITITLYIHLNAFKPEPLICTCDMSQFGHALISTCEVSVPFPEVTPEYLAERKMSALREQQQKILSDAQTKANELEDQVQKLLIVERQTTTNA